MTRVNDIAAGYGAAILLALAALDERQRYVIVQRFWHETPHREIGEKLGVSNARVWQLERSAKRTLRRELAPIQETAA